MPTKADLLADLLDGELDPADAPADLVELAGLAADVRQYVVPLPPSPAFREALREELVQTAGAGTAGAGATAGGGTVGGAGAATGILPSVVAAVAAGVVLVSGGAALTAESVPGDALYDLKRGVESVQLAVADDQRDVDLLAEHAIERLREALDVADVRVVTDLLHESERLFHDALALAAAQGRAVDALVERQTGALLTLASRSEDAVVDGHVRELLVDLGVDAARPGADAPRTGEGPAGDGAAPDPGPSSPGLPDAPSEPDQPTTAPDEPTGELPDDPTSELPEDPVGELPGDLVEDLLDDPTQPLETPTQDAGDLLDGGGLGG